MDILRKRHEFLRLHSFPVPIDTCQIRRPPSAHKGSRIPPNPPAFAVTHSLRLAFKWQVSIAGWDVPMWLSAVACVIAAYLAYEGFQIRKNT